MCVNFTLVLLPKKEELHIPTEKDPLECVREVKRVTQRKQELPLPNPFPLPRNFTPAVTTALQEKKLTGKTRAKFVTALANAIFIYKSYPTLRELEDVCRAATKKWEFLATKSGFVSPIV